VSPEQGIGRAERKPDLGERSNKSPGVTCRRLIEWKNLNG